MLKSVCYKCKDLFYRLLLFNLTVLSKQSHVDMQFPLPPVIPSEFIFGAQISLLSSRIVIPSLSWTFPSRNLTGAPNSTCLNLNYKLPPKPIPPSGSHSWVTQSPMPKGNRSKNLQNTVTLTVCKLTVLMNCTSVQKVLKYRWLLLN